MSTKRIAPYPHTKQQAAIATVMGEPWASFRIAAPEALVNRSPQALQMTEARYPTTYPDVIDAKAVGGVRAHCISNGHFEGRRAFSMPVGEIWYREEFGDTGQAIANGKTASAAENSEKFGYDEGRLSVSVA